jgi:hypothetical protein
VREMLGLSGSVRGIEVDQIGLLADRGAARPVCSVTPASERSAHGGAQPAGRSTSEDG